MEQALRLYTDAWLIHSCPLLHSNHPSHQHCCATHRTCSLPGTEETTMQLFITRAAHKCQVHVAHELPSRQWRAAMRVSLGRYWACTRSVSTARMLVRLNVVGVDGAAGGQFYLPELSGCWKLDGRPCDGDLHTDVTRYLCFVIAPGVRPAWCAEPTALSTLVNWLRAASSPATTQSGFLMNAT